MFLDLVFDIYDKFPGFATPMHFAGGFILTFTFFPLLNYLNKEKYFFSDKFTRFVFTISLVGLTGIFWEFYEFSLVNYFGLDWILTYNDTIWDLFVDLIGGIVASVWFLLKK
ncbi:MAG: hypothetical protein AABY03_01380 [Nanoarchaeota archaeon]